jgi:dTDP-4-dehydrorhamnose 3,5-epimerase
MNVGKIELSQLTNDSAKLSIFNLKDCVVNPNFFVKRIYWISDFTKGKSRGHHAHKTLGQIFVCVSGECRITFHDGTIEESHLLNSNSDFALEISAGLWREIHPLTSDLILLVLADEEYFENDYIRSFDDFLKFKGGVKKN